MKTLALVFIVNSVTVFLAAGQKYTGNDLAQFIPDKNDDLFFVDPIDDTVNYKHVVDKIYRDDAGAIYLRDVSVTGFGDSVIAHEYFHDYSNFIELKTYRRINDSYFGNKEKVYLWYSNSDGTYPLEIRDADLETFRPFDNVCGGTDWRFVFCGSPQGGVEIIDGADPETIKVLNPRRGCWNCGNAYFKDDKNVFFALKKIEGADVKTFKLVDQENIDCTDKRRKYFDGKVIQP